jgi:hypothetical protein
MQCRRALPKFGYITIIIIIAYFYILVFHCTLSFLTSKPLLITTAHVTKKLKSDNKNRNVDVKSQHSASN